MDRAAYSGQDGVPTTVTKRPIRYEYCVDIDILRYSNSDIEAFLDMLRYEGSRVIRWSRTERGYLVRLANDKAPVVARWSSFGIVPTQDGAIPLVASLAGIDAAVNL